MSGSSHFSLLKPVRPQVVSSTTGRRRPAGPAALLLAVAVLTWSGCEAIRETDATHQQSERDYLARTPNLPAELEDRILALDPARVTERDIKEVLARAPAPRIINIRGGTQKVYRRMASFSEFLIGMGYPEASVRNPGDGRFAYNCYEDCDRIVGAIAWFYEHEGLRPMVFGHSQGGMQAVKVLHRLAQSPSHRIPLWNPFTWTSEGATEFLDPVTGQKRPVVGLVLPYVSSVGAGGLTRVLPNQWDLAFSLRSIPDTTEEFTGFCKEWDLLGGDLLGYTAVNEYHATGTAVVQNVWLPTAYDHATLPETRHLAEDAAIRDWLNAYRPSNEKSSTPKLEAHFDAPSDNILWAAEVWYRIKKHWVLEVQRYVRMKRQHRARSTGALEPVPFNSGPAGVAHHKTHAG